MLLVLDMLNILFMNNLENSLEQFDGNVSEGKVEKYPWKSLIYERQRTLCQTLESSQWHQWPFRKLIERKHLRKWDCSINLQYWNHIQNYPHLLKKSRPRPLSMYLEWSFRKKVFIMAHWLQIWPLCGATCIGANLATMWPHLDWKNSESRQELGK